MDARWQSLGASVRCTPSLPAVSSIADDQTLGTCLASDRLTGAQICRGGRQLKCSTATPEQRLVGTALGPAVNEWSDFGRSLTSAPEPRWNLQGLKKKQLSAR